MPLEQRDPESKARLFVPTTSERAMIKSQRQMNESLEELDAMKKELREILDAAKENK